jgi:hypothetical protein
MAQIAQLPGPTVPGSIYEALVQTSLSQIDSANKLQEIIERLQPLEAVGTTLSGNSDYLRDAVAALDKIGATFESLAATWSAIADGSQTLEVGIDYMDELLGLLQVIAARTGYDAVEWDAVVIDDRSRDCVAGIAEYAHHVLASSPAALPKHCASARDRYDKAKTAIPLPAGLRAQGDELFKDLDDYSPQKRLGRYAALHRFQSHLLNHLTQTAGKPRAKAARASGRSKVDPAYAGTKANPSRGAASRIKGAARKAKRKT